LNTTKPKVVLFSTIDTTFINRDFKLLENISDVKWICSKGIISIIKLNWAMLFRDIGIAWFASVYSAFMVFFAKICKKKSVIIVGGADVITNPTLGYGLLLSKWKKSFVKYALRNATHVLPTSDFLSNASIEVGQYNGDNIAVTYPGLKPVSWINDKKRERLVLSVAHCETVDRIKIKGVDLVIKTAEQMQNVKFRIIGTRPQLLLELGIVIPDNVTMHPFIPYKKLIPEYNNASIYLQMSRIESFGISTCEAMMFGCIPIVSNIGGLPETVGPMNYIIPPEDVNAAVTSINEVLHHTLDSNRKEYSKFAQEKFSMKIRQERFQAILI
tara:strand:+ start:226 stop:1209 length:984 start_codon:yes stop_codon:yes gene_type:complete